MFILLMHKSPDFIYFLELGKTIVGNKLKARFIRKN